MTSSYLRSGVTCWWKGSCQMSQPQNEKRRNGNRYFILQTGWRSIIIQHLPSIPCLRLNWSDTASRSPNYGNKYGNEHYKLKIPPTIPINIRNKRMIIITYKIIGDAVLIKSWWSGDCQSWQSKWSTGISQRNISSRNLIQNRLIQFLNHADINGEAND